MIYVGSKAVRCTTGSMWMHVLREKTAIIRAMAEKEAGSCDTKRHTKRDTKFDMFRMFQMFQNS